MKKRVATRVMGMVLAGVFLLSAAGCSNQPVNAASGGGGSTAAAETQASGGGGKVTIRIGGGPSSSANYTTFAGIGNLITQDHPDYLINTEISTGSQENIRMIQSGTVQFGVAMTDVEEAAFKGTREFEGSPVEICHVMGGYTTMLHMFVPKDSDVNSIGDLKGKKLAATKGIKLLSIDEEHIEKISSENPFFYKSVIPGGTYTGVDQDTVVLGTRNNLICAKSVDDEIVYNVVKSIIEHHDDLADVHPQANQFNKENAVEGALIDIHPGAVKYYKEIGIMN